MIKAHERVMISVFRKLSSREALITMKQESIHAAMLLLLSVWNR